MDREAVEGVLSKCDVSREAVEGVLSGCDVSVCLATGGGKSLCFQLPATVLPGVTIVISPLISLMQDQVEHCQSFGIAAEMLNGQLKTLTLAPRALSLGALVDPGIAAAMLNAQVSAGTVQQIMARLQDRRKVQQIMARLQDRPRAQLQFAGESSSSAKQDPLGPIKLLYITPESGHCRAALTDGIFSRREVDAAAEVAGVWSCVRGGALQQTLKGMHGAGRLSLIAIDEAHCISSWGHDFRPAFRALDRLRDTFPGISPQLPPMIWVPMIALTATATPRVRADIVNTLKMREPRKLSATFNRPNIHYEVRYKDQLADEADVDEDMAAFLEGRKSQCGIVYCHKTADCDTLLEYLRDKAFSASAYHSKHCDTLVEFLRDKGFSASAYHSKRSAGDRARTLQEWSSG
ncbi:P-loop containing nucleoside triphosphate hydrolase protein [Baffinella frigidus]|nr:P-loop containing nucleoside triphosphate hydrolase protein [Cryptophyta sp. CCMP2293]